VEARHSLQWKTSDRTRLIPSKRKAFSVKSSSRRRFSPLSLPERFAPEKDKQAGWYHGEFLRP
jgi:hypothetical protein